MFDFFLCSWAHVICCLWRFKCVKWRKEVGEGGECVMRTVISVPLMGAASTLLILGVIPAQPQQRSRELQCGQDEVLQCQQKPHSDVGVQACRQGYSNKGFKFDPCSWLHWGLNVSTSYRISRKLFSERYASRKYPQHYSFSTFWYVSTLIFSHITHCTNKCRYILLGWDVLYQHKMVHNCNFEGTRCLVSNFSNWSNFPTM